MIVLGTYAATYNAFNFSGPVILNKIVGFLGQSAAYEAAQQNAALLVSHLDIHGSQ